MNHRQTAIIKKWINVVRDPVTGKALKQDDLPEQVRLLLDENLHQEVVPVFEHTNYLSLIHISEPTRLRRISYAVFCFL